MHAIDAEIARLRLADDGVEIRAVAVEIGPGLLHGAGDFHDLRLENAAGIGVREHDRRDIRTEQLLHVLHMHRAIGAGGNGLHLEADQSGGRRVGAMGRIRHQHHAARCALPLASMAALIAIMPQSSPCAPAFGDIATASVP